MAIFPSTITRLVYYLKVLFFLLFPFCSPGLGRSFVLRYTVTFVIFPIAACCWPLKDEECDTFYTYRQILVMKLLKGYANLIVMYSMVYFHSHVQIATF